MYQLLVSRAAVSLSLVRQGRDISSQALIGRVKYNGEFLYGGRYGMVKKCREGIGRFNNPPNIQEYQGKPFVIAAVLSLLFSIQPTISHCG